ncbi:MAG: hypothetical protein IKK66_10870 [Ruminococcus sp.]|nr:hypothetical protein [Ruminococcus sp.]
MVCSVCGTNNDDGFKFCVKCGSNMENPNEVNYESVDRGNYHSEEEFSESSGGFTMGDGVFIIKDTAPPAEKKNIYTSDELNKSDEEFDFSIYDEPAIPAVNPPQPIQQTAYPQQPANPYPQQPMMYTQPQIVGYDQNGMPVYSQPQPMMYAQPQIIGYDSNGMPVYSQPQPMVYAQPQIIGYDPNGMPIYSQPQPMMYAQPQIIGYDPNGMPIYSQPQPTMYAQPQIVGYDPNGMPIYSQPQPMPYAQPQPQIPAPQIPAEPEKTEEKKEVPDNKQAFWDFFNEGKKEPAPQKEEKDFFGRFKADTIDPNDPFADIDNRRKQRLNAKAEQERNNGVMGNMPVVDGSKLEKNDSSKINNLYMRQIKDSSSADLTVGTGKHKNRTMEETKEVDASKLSENLNVKSRVSMGYTDDVNADDIEKANLEHSEAIMAHADHAVEAMPKKTKYESEIDKIELPEYMQAKKTVRDNSPEIPSLPEI